MESLQLIGTEPLIFAFAVFVLGCTVGSFLNVVCLRLPLIMEREWRAQCHETLGIPAEEPPAEPFNLAFPPSRCPKCGHSMRPWEHIPVISYLLLKGRCCSLAFWTYLAVCSSTRVDVVFTDTGYY